MKTLFVIIIALVSLTSLLSGCGSSPATTVPTSAQPIAATSPSGAAGQNVILSGFAFSPASLTVSPGTTVTWTNNDQVTHTVTSDNGVWDSGSLGAGKTFSFTFNQAGSFPYHCAPHPRMTAVITVQ